MIKGRLALVALGNRLLSTVVASHNAVNIAASATAYTRASGSWITDGYLVGMEIVASGFTNTGNNGQGVISELSATVMTIGRAYNVSTSYAVTDRTMVTEGSASGRTISATIPAMRRWDNTKLTPVAGIPYIEEEFVPATNRNRTVPAATAFNEDTGVYFVKWFGLSDTGESIRVCADAVLAEFAPGTPLTLSDGTTLRIPVDLGPKAGQVTRVDGGWSYSQIELPYIGESINALV